MQLKVKHVSMYYGRLAGYMLEDDPCNGEYAGKMITPTQYEELSALKEIEIPEQECEEINEVEPLNEAIEPVKDEEKKEPTKKKPAKRRKRNKK